MLPTLAEKLHIKPGWTIALLNAPQTHAGIFGSLPQGTHLTTEARGRADLVFLFTLSRKDLEKSFPKALKLLGEDTPCWIAFPKLSGSIRSDLTRDQGWETVSMAGLRPVSLIAIDDTWSALRFRRLELVKKTDPRR